MKFWVVGASHDNKDVSKYFLNKGIWFDGYAKDGDNRNQTILNEVKIGDVVLMKSSSTKGKNRSISFTKLKGVGIIVNKINNYSFSIEWSSIKELPKDFDGISYRKTIEIVREDKLLTYARQVIEKKAPPLSYSNQLHQFIKQANTDNLKTKHYIDTFKNLKVKVSFGQGNSARIPWISFLKKPNTTNNGIYPVYLLFKDIQRLILSYGISETNKPATEWRLTNPITIKKYFEDNNLRKPERYGNSYVFKVYDINNLPDPTILNKDIDEIIESYINITPLKTSVVTQKEFSLNDFMQSLKKSGLIFSQKLVARLVSSLVTKPFVLLTGLSGSGKTKLAQAFAQWISQDESQFKIVPVGADWTNREPLLGYTNALDPEEYVIPHSGAVDIIIRANTNLELPYFLILDEMNLSHVERYFADFLSVMESNDTFKLHDGTCTKVPSQLDWPPNLFIVGTVNIDETTYMFSPKVLDRANVIEFRISEDEIGEFLHESKVLKSITNDGAKMAESFVRIAENKEIKSSEKLKETLNSFFTELQKVGAEFGYRTALEIQILFTQIAKINPAYSDKDKENEKIDIAIMQKLLPKLHGSRRKLDKVLTALGELCYKGDVKHDFFENNADLDFSKGKYPLSLEKITRMYKSLIENGFTSYAEA